MRRVEAAALGVLLIGCVADPSAFAQGGEEHGEASTGNATSSTSVGPLSTDASTTTSDDSRTGAETLSSSSSTSGEDVPAGFLAPPDTASAYQCSTWDQNCPVGEKCTSWMDADGNSWNATRCLPVDSDPDSTGEACSVVDGVFSGIDSCDLGLMCWGIDPATNTGTCVAYCVGSEGSPVCEYANAMCDVFESGMALCLPQCDPLAQDCAPDEVCIPAGDVFHCAFDASGEMGAPGDPCEYANVCDAGFFCAAPSGVPGCAEKGCCSAFCDLDAPSCAAGQQCVAAFEPGHAPWGLEDVGSCLVP